MSSGRTRWDIVALALAAGYIVGLQVGKVPPALPLLEAEFGLPRVIAGLIASSFYGVGAVFGVAGGLLIDQFGARRMVLAGAAVMALASLAGGLAGDGTLLLATRIVEGFGFATLTVAAPKLIAAATRAEVRRLALGAWGTYMPVGMSLSLVIATAVLETIGWRGLWFLNAGLILIYALAFAWWTAPRRWHPLADVGADAEGSGGRATRPPPGPWRFGAGARATLSRPGPWLFGSCFVLFSIQWLALMTWLPTFLIETQGRSLGGAALFTALIVSFTGLGVVTGASLLRQGAARWLLIGTAYVAMGACAAALFAPVTPDVSQDPARALLHAARRPAARRLLRRRRRARAQSGAGRHGERLRGAGRRDRQRPRPAPAGRRDRSGRRLGICMVDHADLPRHRPGGGCRRAQGGRASRAGGFDHVTDGFTPQPEPGR